MALLWLMHLASYLINRTAFNKKFFDERNVDNFQREDIENEIYRPVMEQFRTTKSLWLVQITVYLYVLYIYYKEHDTQLICDLWIPLDFLIFMSMGLYAYICLREQMSKKQE